MVASHPQVLVSLTNIPTPYRLHFYKALAQVLTTQAIDLQVWFMAKTEPGRHWNLEPQTFDFKYRFSPGVHPTINNRQFHLNPSFFFSLFKNPPQWLLLSGSWYFPTFLGSLIIALLRKSKIIIWSESNLAYVEYSQPLINKLRRFVLDLADAYAVPGQWAAEYVTYYLSSSKNKPFLHLPNVIDENKFLSEISTRRAQGQVIREKWMISPSQRVILSLTRLEPIKGVLQMLQGWVKSSRSSDVVWLIAGDGSLMDGLQNKIQEFEISNSVRLLGHRSEEEVFDLLAVSDAFALPSLGDPYPLAVIEAMFAGLPLLLSDRVGCHPETLVADANGLLFNPYDVNSIAQKLEALLSLTPEQWQAMGRYSKNLAVERFGTEKIIKNFVAELLLL